MKTAFVDKVIERLDRLDPKSLQVHFLRLAQEKGLMETVFQAILEGIIVLDGNGRVSYLNRAAEKLLGLNQTSVLGRHISLYLQDIDWERILGFDPAEWSRMITQEIEISAPTHRILSFYIASLSPGASQERGILIMLRDITRDRELEAGLVESERMNALKLLAAGVAHEIGNPLNALNIHLQLIRRELENLPADAKAGVCGLLDVATKEVSRLDMIIAQFLRAIRPSPPNLELAQIEDIVKQTLTLLKPEIENRNICVELDTTRTLPKIHVDRHQMNQAFFNVIKNALQAMFDGGRLRISFAVTDRYATISFRDTGTGIAKENLGRVFDSYYTTKADGSGLGLMIVQRIVHEHGGAIEVQSEPDMGTTFTILLPLTQRQQRLLKPSSVSPEERT